MTAYALEDLPDEVRARIARHACGVLPEVAVLPPALRRIAGFAPASRARVGASTVLEALAGSDGEELRTRVAAVAGPRLTGPATDPVEQAARAWLLRPEGAAELLEEALDRLRAAEQVGAEEAARRKADRLQVELDAARRALADSRADLEAELEDVRAENRKLRRRLGEARAQVREAQSGDESRLEAAARARADAETRAAALQEELTASRAEVARLQERLRARRSDTRAERDEASLRVRVLLDTLAAAAGGLRRELALPAVTGAPGERLERELAAAGEPAGRWPVRSATELEQLLSMPRARLLVDGYNVSKGLWPDISLAVQRQRLLAGLAALVARTGAETTVVFDAAATTSRPVTAAPRGVKVLFSPPGVIADDVIVDLVAAEPSGRVVLVVSDDAQVARDVARGGARPVPVSLLGERFGAS